jgi:hypothetical protein
VSDPPEVLRTVGGLVDETAVTLAVYGEDLVADDVTRLLGVEPSSSHRRGDRRGPRSAPYKKGAWFLQQRGEAPLGPEELTTTLLDRLPSDEATWIRVGELYEVQVRFGIHFYGWNRGFDLSAALIARIAKLRAKLVYDLYAYDEEPPSGDRSA